MLFCGVSEIRIGGMMHCFILNVNIFFCVLVRTFVKINAPEANRPLGKIKNFNGTCSDYFS